MGERFEFGVYEYQVDAVGVSRRRKGSDDAWATCSLQQLRATAPASSSLWEWLKANGIKRPSPSGPSGADANRTTVAVYVRLPPEDAESLKAIAANMGIGVGQLISQWVRRAR
jgi:hypothetical protein